MTFFPTLSLDNILAMEHSFMIRYGIQLSQDMDAREFMNLYDRLIEEVERDNKAKKKRNRTR